MISDRLFTDCWSHSSTTHNKGKRESVLWRMNVINLCLAVTFIPDPINTPQNQAKGKLEERPCTRLTRDFDSRLHGQPSLSFLGRMLLTLGAQSLDYKRKVILKDLSGTSQETHQGFLLFYYVICCLSPLDNMVVRPFLFFLNVASTGFLFLATTLDSSLGTSTGCP